MTPQILLFMFGCAFGVLGTVATYDVTRLCSLQKVATLQGLTCTETATLRKPHLES